MDSRGYQVPLGEKTSLTMYLVIPLIGAVVWLTTVHAKVDRLEEDYKTSAEFQKEAIDRLARIETMLKKQRHSQE